MVVSDVTISPMTATRLALDLAVTIRHDGHGGITDDLADPEGLAVWVRERAALLDCAEPPVTVDEALHTAVRELRAALRSLFARAVRPGPPSSADAHRLLPGAEAIHAAERRRGPGPHGAPAQLGAGRTAHAAAAAVAPRRPPTGSSPHWPAPPSPSSTGRTAPCCAPAPPRAVCATS